MTSSESIRAANISKLAELAVNFGVNLQDGQELIVTAPIAAVDFVREITDHAYRAGSKLVTVIYSDDAAALSRYENGHDASFDYAPAWLYSGIADAFRNGAARLAVSGDTPGLLKGQDAARISRANRAQAAATKPFIQAITTLETNWSIVPFASAGWAAQVFPHLPASEATDRLWDLILNVTRADRDDPVAVWEDHIASLETRISRLQSANFWGLRFFNGQTDLTVGLADNHVWQGGAVSSQKGVRFAPNLPTEEVFSMPHRDRVNGRAVFTKPVALQGSIVDGLVVEFKDGRAIGVKAKSGQDVFEKFVATDEGSCFLGEVALVAHSSPISNSDVLFFNTLFDENAACHIAFGMSYSMNLPKDADGPACGANTSSVHMDCMIGDGAMNVDGIAADKSVVPIMRDGEFVL